MPVRLLKMKTQSPGRVAGRGQNLDGEAVNLDTVSISKQAGLAGSGGHGGTHEHRKVEGGVCEHRLVRRRYRHRGVGPPTKDFRQGPDVVTVAVGQEYQAQR